MRAALLCLLVLAAAAGGSAFYTESLVLEAVKDAQDALAELRLDEPKLSRAEMMMATPLEANSECATCVKGSAKWVMDHVVAFLKKKCAETECPKTKRMCEKAAAHPEVTFGFLIAAVRPVALGYAWCNGKGECGKEEAEMFAGHGEMFLAEPLDALQAEGERLDALELYEDEADDEFVFEVDADEDEDEEAGRRRACRGCIKGVSKGVMWKTIGKIKKFCATTEDPKAQRMCAAAKAHPKEAFGYLFYKIRPVEYAAGFCLGKGKCSFKANCDQYHDEIVFDLMDDDAMSLDDGAEDAAIFY